MVCEVDVRLEEIIRMYGLSFAQPVEVIIAIKI
jgi:hypothetical protein